MSKRYTLLLSGISVLILVLLFMLCFYSRLATDDYYFIWDVQTHGVTGSVCSQYMEWCGRYAATWITGLFYKAWGIDQTWYFLWPAFSVIMLAIAVYRLFSVLSKKYGTHASMPERFIFSLSFLALLFFFSVDIGETWMWYCSLSSYLWSVIAFLWGSYFLLVEKKIVSVLCALICFVYAGGSSEVYSVIYGVSITAFLIYRYRKTGNPKRFFSDPFHQKLIIAYLVLGIAFIILIIAPGNYLRDQLFPEHHLGKALFITAKSLVKFAAIYVPFRLIYLLAFAVPFVVAGRMFSLQKQPFRLSFRDFFIRSTFAYASLLLLFFLLVAYVMVETGPPRLWFMVAFLSTAYCCSVCFYAGYSGLVNEAKIRLLKRSGILLAALILSYNIIHQYSLCRDYATAEDQRISHLLELNNLLTQDTLIIVPALPSSGMLYSAEIKADTNYFTNKELRLGLDLKFHVAVNR